MNSGFAFAGAIAFFFAFVLVAFASGIAFAFAALVFAFPGGTSGTVLTGILK